MHDLTLVLMLAWALSAALALGWLTQRFGLSPLVGYLLAGVVVGPYTPGFVANAALASQLAEMGVVLLMFSVGLHFHPQDLLRVWRIAVPGAIAQAVVATGLGWLVARGLGWSHLAGLILGLSLSVASTVVLTRMLMEQHRLHLPAGQVAMGWLIIEDLFTVIALVLIPVLVLAAGSAGELILGLPLILATGKVVAFAAAAWLLGPKLVSPLLERMAHTRSAELFTLTVFVLALGIAAIASELFHLSVALGAFLAGLIVGQSRLGSQAAADMSPFRDVFSAMFFVSIGMLFNPAFVFENPEATLAVLGVILIAKPLVALALVLILRHPLHTGITVAVGLAQIGEFSFILGAMGKTLGVLPEEGFNVLVAGALISIAINPLLFKGAAKFEKHYRNRSLYKENDQISATDSYLIPGPDIVIIGYGPVGRSLSAKLLERRSAVVVIDNNLKAVDVAELDGLTAVFGDAGTATVLRKAGVPLAKTLVIATSVLPAKMRIALAARQLNPGINIVTFAAGSSEQAWLEEFGIQVVTYEANELSAVLLRAIT